MDFDILKAALEKVGLSVYKMNFPITLVGNTEESAMPLAARCNRFKDLNQCVRMFEGYHNDGLQTVYLYKVLTPDHNDKLFRVRAAWHLDANGPNDVLIPGPDGTLGLDDAATG